MARPPLAIGTYGKVTRKKIDGVPTAFARYRDVDGRTRAVQRIGKTLAEAERNLKDALVDRKRDTEPSAVLSLDSTIDDLIAEWLEESRAAERYAAATMRTYKLRASYLISPGIGGVRLKEVTVPMLDRFVKLVIKSNGTGSAATCRSVLINAFDLATRHGLTELNLARNTAPVPVKKTVPDAPDADKVKRFIAFLKKHDEDLRENTNRLAYLYDLNIMYAATGVRTSELLALEWPQVEDDGTDVWVSIIATLSIGEDNKLFRQGYTKSDSGMRRLKVPQFAANILRERRLNAYNEIVFPSSTGSHRWPANVRDDWRTALKGTEFEKMTPTVFRKAVATIIRDVIGIEAARDQLGHSSDEVTKKHYAKRVHDAPDSTAALDRFFTP